MLLNLKYFIFIYLILPIFSYVSFPLNNDDYNLTLTDSPKETMEKLINSKLHIIVNIGSEKVNIKAYIVLNREEFMIGGKRINYNKYNESNSKSYKCEISNCSIKEFYDGCQYTNGIISTEDFNILNDKNEISVVKKMKFILGTKAKDENTPEGFVGFKLSYYDSNLEYNLIYILKNLNVTNSYFWHLNYDNEPKMIIGGFPHDLNSKKYNPQKFFSTNALTLNGGYYIYWGLEFSQIYYDNMTFGLSTDKSASIRFDYKLIRAPEETSILLEKEFFSIYYNKNICFKERLKTKELFIYCKNINEFDAKKFKNIYFKSVDLNCFFELNFKDLFYYKDNYIYFSMLFKGNSWIFGELFLKKYYLVFNQDQKTVGYYKNINIEIPNGRNENEFKVDILLISLILFLICIIVVLIIVYFKKGKRKSRTNELEDNYEYNESINNIENYNNKILE